MTEVDRKTCTQHEAGIPCARMFTLKVTPSGRQRVSNESMW